MFRKYDSSFPFLPGQNLRRIGFSGQVSPGGVTAGVVVEMLLILLPGVPFEAQQYTTLFFIFDYCHSGSAIELLFVYCSDIDGNISLMDDVKTGINLI
jgi:hypothetical protein